MNKSEFTEKILDQVEPRFIEEALETPKDKNPIFYRVVQRRPLIVTILLIICLLTGLLAFAHYRNQPKGPFINLELSNHDITPVYPCQVTDKYKPTITLSKNRKVFPDVLNSFKDAEDFLNHSGIHVASLNAFIEIPDGFYLYVIPGQYWDSTAKQSVTLEFVREYIFTMTEVSEEKLLEDIQTYFQREHSINDYDYRGPGYVVYSFRIFRKEYLPIENLFTSLLASTGEYFFTKDYYCSMGRSAWKRNADYSYYTNMYDPLAIDDEFQSKSLEEQEDEGMLFLRAESFPLKNWINALLEATEQPVFGSESILFHDSVPSGKKPESFFYGAKSMFQSGSASYYVNPNAQLSSTSLQAANVTASIVSDEWWYNYQNALDTLSKNLNDYTFNQTLQFNFSTWNNESPDPAENQKDNELQEDWVYDPQKTLPLQAYIFANLSSFRKYPLECILIISKELDDGSFLYIATIPKQLGQPDVSDYRILEWGWSALNEADLQFAREYALQYF